MPPSPAFPLLHSSRLRQAAGGALQTSGRDAGGRHLAECVCRRGLCIRPEPGPGPWLRSSRSSSMRPWERPFANAARSIGGDVASSFQVPAAPPHPERMARKGWKCGTRPSPPKSTRRTGGAVLLGKERLLGGSGPSRPPGRPAGKDDVGMGGPGGAADRRRGVRPPQGQPRCVRLPPPRPPPAPPTSGGALKEQRAPHLLLGGRSGRPAGVAALSPSSSPVGWEARRAPPPPAPGPRPPKARPVPSAPTPRGKRLTPSGRLRPSRAAQPSRPRSSTGSCGTSSTARSRTRCSA